jgi:hypothetical protein
MLLRAATITMMVVTARESDRHRLRVVEAAAVVVVDMVEADVITIVGMIIEAETGTKNVLQEGKKKEPNFFVILACFALNWLSVDAEKRFTPLSH